MGVLHVGDSNCTHDQIARVMISSTTKSVIRNQFYNLMLHLNTEDLVRDKYWKKIESNPDMYLGEVIFNVLQEWTSREPREKVTLDIFLAALRKCALSSIATDIEREFFGSNHETFPSSPHQNGEDNETGKSLMPSDLTKNRNKKYRAAIEPKCCSVQNKAIVSFAVGIFVVIAGVLCWVVAYVATRDVESVITSSDGEAFTTNSKAAAFTVSSEATPFTGGSEFTAVNASSDVMAYSTNSDVPAHALSNNVPEFTASPEAECSFTGNSSDEVVTKWSAEILYSQDYNNIYKDLQSCSNSSQIVPLFEKAVVVAFGGKMENASTILDFLRELKHFLIKYHGFAALHNAMAIQGYERTKEMMKLIYYVRLAMSDTASVDANLFRKFENLKSKFPDDMRAIIFSERVTIKDSRYNEYIYVSKIRSAWLFGNNLVLSWRPGNIRPSGAHFVFHPGDVNGRVYYIINNQKPESRISSQNFYEIIYDAPLCMTDNWLDSDNRMIGTCPGEDNDYLRWFVDPKGSYFTFKNWDTRFLYAPNNQHFYDKDSRFVFSWRGEPVDMSNNSNWQYIITKS